MANIIRKTKIILKEINWPTKKEVITDTLFTLGVTVVLSLLILLWTSGIDKMINWIIGLAF
jgi:preprotein translocase SecE subunit